MNAEKMTADEIHDYLNEHTHCSALIKLKDGMGDILAGHSVFTFFIYLNNFLHKISFI